LIKGEPCLFYKRLIIKKDSKIIVYRIVKARW